MILPEPLQIPVQAYEDSRGRFVPLFNTSGHPLGNVDFVQDNLSMSHQWVIRGLHYQLPPHQQGKLISVVHGEIFDVAVDLRRESPGFGRWWGFRLGGTDPMQAWIPAGFAHGFLTLTEPAVVHYKVTSGYSPESERTVRWDDDTIGIDWPLEGHTPTLSERDRTAPTLHEAEVF